ncbi:hypothetical protein Cob_v004043 [Colletotrichum orbiculare MAFF 240422]|uniref:Uncharacterized protein n=1 Tax=Colletotrichum orbiculare (strain 104-T / ATCC 96160 / CBS 514.97 / LARS 414 / MAFF 240422) TaxID=1213857 RepID=A0A484FZX9_COLOR|nr:hypothetical protein Cob_v004043 [Colletotrichum orbiculare MAFF 240422]
MTAVVSNPRGWLGVARTRCHHRRHRHCCLGLEPRDFGGGCEFWHIGSVPFVVLGSGVERRRTNTSCYLVVFFCVGNRFLESQGLRVVRGGVDLRNGRIRENEEQVKTVMTPRPIASIEASHRTRRVSPLGRVPNQSYGWHAEM